MLVGMPGSGKSTWARTFFDPWCIVSSDAIRAEKWPGEDYQDERNEETFAEFFRRVGEMLEEGKTVVADTTGLWQSFRWKISDLGDYYDAEKHLVFFNNPDQALRRNASRSDKTRVPPEAMDRMLEKYRDARDAILDERYTSTTIIQATS